VTLAPLVARAWRGLPRVLTCHGIITPDLRHKVMSAVDLWCMRRASRLIAVAETSAAMLRAAVPSVPVHLIPNGILPPTRGVDPARRQTVRAELAANQADTVLIGYVGRLSGEKRPDLLVAAASLLKATDASARFAIVGGGQLAPNVTRAVREAGLGDRVALAGLRHDMDDVYAAIDVLAVPSDIEGTPRVLIEAQMRGIPAVATAVGGMPALVRDEVDGLLIPPGRADALAEALSRLIRDPDMRRRLGAAAATSAHGRTAHGMAEAVQAVYDCLR
jgi:glycosyltransferase involved in cell wall biosynthesis